MELRMHACLWACLVLCLAPCVSAISFGMSGTSTKCLHEDVEKDVLMVGEYQITGTDNVVVTIKISDSQGHPVYRREDAEKGKFAFTSDDYDVFQICFYTEVQETGNPNSKVEISLDIKIGAEARNYEELGKAEKLKPMELQLRRLEDLSEAIVKSFATMREREHAHRDTNESTSEKMLHFSIFSMVCLLGLAGWQVWYLRRYFQRKKIL
eukprot:m.77143 g.77143  ORF g.77143 m.77143 type:complete len:210 (-) comp12503_c0_seq1:1767-2396(-)